MSYVYILLPQIEKRTFYGKSCNLYTSIPPTSNIFTLIYSPAMNYLWFPMTRVVCLWCPHPCSSHFLWLECLSQFFCTWLRLSLETLSKRKTTPTSIPTFQSPDWIWHPSMVRVEWNPDYSLVSPPRLEFLKDHLKDDMFSSVSWVLAGPGGMCVSNPGILWIVNNRLWKMLPEIAAVSSRVALSPCQQVTTKDFRVSDDANASCPSWREQATPMSRMPQCLQSRDSQY